MELLGHDLAKLLKKQPDFKFSFKTTLMLGHTLIRILQNIHK